MSQRSYFGQKQNRFFSDSRKMPFRGSSWSRRMGALMVTCALSAATLAVSSGAAHAGLVQFSDGFENQPAATWEFDTGGDGSAGYDIGHGTARTGANNGWLYGRYGGASEKIWVNTDAVPHVDGTECAAQIYVNAPSRTTVVLEIWAPTSGKRYTVDRTVSGGGYLPVNTERWPLYGEPRMQFRIVMHGGGDAGPNFVRLDDLIVQCYW